MEVQCALCTPQIQLSLVARSSISNWNKTSIGLCQDIFVFPFSIGANALTMFQAGLPGTMAWGHISTEAYQGKATYKSALLARELSCLNP